jgi:lysophospholipase L1-like esterase
VTAEAKGWGTMPERAWADGYRADYGAALAQVRGDQPQRDCLVLSTLTRAVDENGRIAVFPSVPLRVEAQRAEATKNGCAFWNTYEAIGGRDGPARWVAHRPRLLALDLRHPTREGYQRLARMFYASLMHGFRGWLVERLGRGA